jgi:hypothetical protein
MTQSIARERGNFSNRSSVTAWNSQVARSQAGTGTATIAKITATPIRKRKHGLLRGHMSNTNRLSDWVMRGANFVLSGSDNAIPTPSITVPGGAPTQYDLVRRNSFIHGADTMRNKFVERMTWFAEYAPSRESADYLWRVIMDVKDFRVTPEDAD